MKKLPTLKKEYPASDGWIIATMDLRPGAILTEDEFRCLAGKDAEIPYFEQDGRRAVAAYRAAPRKTPDPALLAQIHENLSKRYDHNDGTFDPEPENIVPFIGDDTTL